MENIASEFEEYLNNKYHFEIQLNVGFSQPLPEKKSHSLDTKNKSQAIF